MSQWPSNMNSSLRNDCATHLMCFKLHSNLRWIQGSRRIYHNSCAHGIKITLYI